MRDNEVKELQRFLNTNSFPVAQAGVGSLNNESSYFGPRTQEALIKYQKSKSVIPPVGYFGPLTRGVVNK